MDCVLSSKLGLSCNCGFLKEDKKKCLCRSLRIIPQKKLCCYIFGSKEASVKSTNSLHTSTIWVRIHLYLYVSTLVDQFGFNLGRLHFKKNEFYFILMLGDQLGFILGRLLSRDEIYFINIIFGLKFDLVDLVRLAIFYLSKFLCAMLGFQDLLEGLISFYQ